MKRLIFSISLASMTMGVVEVAVAQRQSAVGPGTIPLDASGILGGVDMSASGTTGTLSVGVIGGPKTDIFTLNNPPVAGFTAVSTAASSQGNINFNSSSDVFGAIGVTQPGGPFLRNIAAGSAGTTVNFLGPVYATRLDVTQTGTVNFNSGSINIIATNFAGDGSIGLAANTTVIGAMTTTAGANTGTLSMSGGSVLDGAVGGAVGLRSVNVLGGSNLAGTTATVTGALNAFTFNLGTNTLNVGGALTIANSGPGGVVNTTLASPTVFGNIRPVGATNLGSTLRVNVNVPATAFIPVGTRFNIVQTRAGTVQSGTDGSVLNVTVQNPTNPLYTFSAVPAAGTVAGEVSIVTTGIPLLVPIAPPPGAVLPPTLPVAVAVVPALIAVAPTAAVAGPAPTSDLVTTVLPALNALSDPTQVVNAVVQLAPSAPVLAAPLVTFQGSRQFQGMVLSRLEETLCRSAPDRDQASIALCRDDQRAGWWMRGVAYSASQGSRNAYTGYDSSVLGVMVGRDTLIGPHTRVGFGIGYARSKIDGQTAGAASAATNFNSYRGTVYIGHERGPWYVHGDASFGASTYEGRRNIAFTGIGRQARSDYNGQDYTAFVGAGHRIPVQGFTLTPMVSLQYTHVNIGNYTETGAGDLSLRIRSQSYNFLESGVGVKLSRAFTHREATYVPEIHARWLHQLSNPTITNSASFTAPGSPEFRVPGLRNAADTFNVGAGITLLSCNCTARNWSVEAGYDYYVRSDNYSAHQGMVRLTGRF